MEITKKRIKDLMYEKRTTQQELAEFIPITQATLSRNLANPEIMSTNTINKIADFFEVSIDYLLGKTNERNQIIEKVRYIPNKKSSPLAETEEYETIINLVNRMTRDELIMLKGLILGIIGTKEKTNGERGIS